MSDERQEKLLAIRAHKNLFDWPRGQAEAIARHYLSLTGIASELRRALDTLRTCPDNMDTSNLDAYLEELVRKVQEQHKEDFGLKLEWVDMHEPGAELPW